MRLTSRMHETQPPEAIFHSHLKAHQIVINNERWYGKGTPYLGRDFTGNNAIKRHHKIREILGRAERRELRNDNCALAQAYSQLQNRLKECHPRGRCGSSACPKCARAFQRAKTDAHLRAIGELGQSRNGKQLVLVTIIPKQYARYPGDFLDLDPLKANRWLRDVLDRNGFRRAMIGSVDFGWEKRAGERYLQLHWHLVMWTGNPKRLLAKLKQAFKAEKVKNDSKCKRPVDVRVCWDMNFVRYVHKLVKLPTLLRAAKRQLPEISLLLGRFDSMDFLFLRKVRISAQLDGVVFKEFG